ncbi:BON domain-containing protein [Nitrospira japonica]|nr:BON domain-containing protein [Nitrospira japonica]
MQWSCSAGLVVALVGTAGCVGAKYKAMLEAAQSELSPAAIAQDDLHKVHIHEAMVAEQGLSSLTLSINVFMERAYLVGHVDNREQGEAVLKTARHVQGIRSVEGYLPVTAPSADGNTMSDKTSDVSLKAQVISALAIEPKVVKSRVHVEVLDGHVVLLGVVSGEPERHHAETAAAGVEGVKAVTNWLLLPEKGYMTIRKKIR